MCRCKECDRTFNKRTGTPFIFIEVPTDILLGDRANVVIKPAFSAPDVISTRRIAPWAVGDCLRQQRSSRSVEGKTAQRNNT